MRSRFGVHPPTSSCPPSGTSITESSRESSDVSQMHNLQIRSRFRVHPANLFMSSERPPIIESSRKSSDVSQMHDLQVNEMHEQRNAPLHKRLGRQSLGAL
ncbi:hypothetical protein CEXT_203841 [Caerostris extrusa]|uniref:Uncharacterized protein n=1 Tax=Caerostris extrusa TaxID=172846 RepID=A0AAV4Y0A8_CAEEX|nr:hypothetical protein CEXT_203841 [Caerostris extrusa]